jgi:hypothetical protein
VNLLKVKFVSYIFEFEPKGIECQVGWGGPHARTASGLRSELPHS